MVTEDDKRALFDPPYKSTMVESSGVLTPAWQRWIRELFTRIGGQRAYSNAQLEDLAINANVDGGRSDSIYLPQQLVDGGDSNG